MYVDFIFVSVLEINVCVRNADSRVVMFSRRGQGNWIPLPRVLFSSFTYTYFWSFFEFSFSIISSLTHDQFILHLSQAEYQIMTLQQWACKKKRKNEKNGQDKRKKAKKKLKR